jgi:hypothetical protein
MIKPERTSHPDAATPEEDQGNIPDRSAPINGVRSLILLKNAFANLLSYCYGPHENSVLCGMLYMAHMHFNFDGEGVPSTLTFHAASRDQEGEIQEQPDFLPFIKKLMTDIEQYSNGDDDLSVTGNTIEFEHPTVLVNLLEYLATQKQVLNLDSLGFATLDFGDERLSSVQLFNEAAREGFNCYTEMLGHEDSANQFLSRLPSRVYTGSSHLHFIAYGIDPAHDYALDYSLEEIATAIHQEFGRPRTAFYNPLCAMN